MLQSHSQRHFLIIVTVSLVITEENDVWSGYLCDRVGGKTIAYSSAANRKIFAVDSCSAAFYWPTPRCSEGVASKAVSLAAVKAQIPVLHYIATVASQVPILDTVLK